MGNISQETWHKLEQCHSEFITQPVTNTLFNTTHIVGFKENAQRINTSICNILPVSNNKFLLSYAIDFMNSN